MTAVTVDGGSTDTGDSIAAVGAYANTATFKDMDTVTATAGITGSVYTITGTTATTVVPGVGIQTITSTSSATTTISDPTAVTTSIVTGASTGAYSITPDVATTFTTIDATLSTAGAITVAAQAATNLAMAIQEGTASAATFTITGGNTGQTITVGGVTPSTTAHTFTSTATSIINYTSAAGIQTITTGVGADTISAGAGADIIAAGTGANSITGGAGVDAITGTGTDTIVLNYSNVGAEADTISSFTTVVDVLQFDLSALETAGTSGIYATASDFSLLSTGVAVATGTTALVTLEIASASTTTAATAASLIVLLDPQYTTTDLLETAFEVGGTEVLTGVTCSAGDSFLVAYSDGTNVYAASMYSIYAVSASTFVSGGLVIDNLIQLTGDTAITTGDYVNWTFIA